MLFLCRVYRITLHAIVLLFISINVAAQNSSPFLDKEYYLVDSLLPEHVSDYDRTLLDSILPLYHNEIDEINQVFLVRSITEEAWGYDLWPKYNKVVYEKSNELLKKKLTNENYIRCKKALSGSIGNFGFREHELGNFDKAKEYYIQALEISREIKDTTDIGTMLNNLAFVYKEKGEISKALRQYKRALELSRKANDNLGIANRLLNIGATYGELGEVNKQILYMDSSLRAYESLNNKSRMGIVLNNLGNIYHAQGNRKEAMIYYKQALSIAIKVGDNTSELYALLSIANVNFELDSINKAIVIYQNILEKAEKLNNKELISEAHLKIGNIFLKQNKIERAELEFINSLKIARDLEKKESIISSLNALGNLKLKQGETSKAELFITEAHDHSVMLNKPIVIESTAILLSRLYDIKGDYKKSLELFRLGVQMNDSIKNEKNQKAVYKQQMKYEFEKKEELLRAEEKQRAIEAVKEKKVRTSIIIGIGCGFCLSIIFLFYLVNRVRLIKRQKKLIEEQSLTLQGAYQDLNELQQFKEGMTGMIVHDLKNPLNAMLGFAEEVQVVNLKTRIRNTTKMMLNYVLNMLDVQKFESQEVPIELKRQSFLKVINEALEQVQFLADEKKVTLINKVNRNYIVNIDSDLIVRVLVNLLTNAIKYSPQNATISIEAIAKSDAKLQIMVVDQGQGIPKDMLDKVFDKFTQVEAKKSGKIKSTGLGLTFCKLAIEGHGGSIWVESEEGKGSKFCFEIPLINDEEEVVTPEESLKSKIELTNKEKMFLSSVKKALAKLDVADTIEIMEVLSQLRISKSAAINTWANQVENACLNVDEVSFQELIE